MFAFFQSMQNKNAEKVKKTPAAISTLLPVSKTHTCLPDFRHRECDGVGSTVFALTEGGPVHDTVLNACNLPPLAFFLGVLAIILPAGAKQAAVNKVIGELVVAELPLAVHQTVEVEIAVGKVFPAVVISQVSLRHGSHVMPSI